MKFFSGIVLVALVALATADEVTKNAEPVNAPAVTDGAQTETNVRDKRGFILSTYGAAIPLAAPAEIVAPYAHTYSAPLRPYSYWAYQTGQYVPYHAYPAFY